MFRWLFRFFFGRPERRVYCWRCSRFVRALSEGEYMSYDAQFWATKRELKEALDRGELDETRMKTILRPLEEECRRLSGEEGIEPSHLYKHRAILYGPPCRRCGRNLRTPQARRCMACGLERGRNWDL
jgi:hypothetical protein